MPELPEVETVRRGLKDLIVGKTVSRALVRDSPKSFPNEISVVESFLYKSKITDVRRRAKVLIIDLSTGYSLVIHLKMTGQLVFVDAEDRFGAGHPNDSLVGKLPDRSTRVEIHFEDGGVLYFNDQRKFGWVRLLPTAEIELLPFFQKVGPEPLEDGYAWEMLKEKLARRKKTSIKAALLDQSVVAGIGNIYADESLWGAKVDPRRLAGSLTDEEIKLLYEQIRFVMNLSIEKGGSTDRNYVDARGKKGSYIDFARVFRKEGQPCHRCGSPILKIRHAGRGTHYCEVCQV